MSEKKVKLKLSEWLEDWFEVYWDMKNDYGYNTFSMKDADGRPDLYLRSKENPHWWNTVIEVKPSKGKLVRKGSKILKYWEDYVKNNAKYFIANRIVNPKYFLQATDMSPKGRLFDENNLKSVEDEGRRKAIDMRLIPPKEYLQTFTHVRQLWVEWTDSYGKVPKGCVGVLLSSVLDGDDEFKPAFQYQEYDKGRWKQRWRVQR